MKLFFLTIFILPSFEQLAPGLIAAELTVLTGMTVMSETRTALMSRSERRRIGLLFISSASCYFKSSLK